MKLLVIGGMHGNEPLGLEVVKMFKDNPVSQVKVLLANERAIEKNCRFVSQDLNRSFPGNSNSAEYEPRRAAEILKLTKKFDVVLDFHNTHCPNNDCGFVGETARESLTDISSLLGLDKVIVADYDCINKSASNCLSVEVSLDSKLNNAELWYERISMLSRIDTFTAKSVIKKYRFVQRISLEDRDRLKLDKLNLGAFEPLSEGLCKDLGVVSPAYPIFIGDKYTPYNYGGLLTEL